MSNLRLVAHPDQPPTRCFMCGDHVGPFVDTRVDMAVWGHLWICCASEGKPGCARQVGRLDGLFDPEERTELISQLQAVQEDLDRAKELLGKRNVPAAELLDALRVAQV